MTNQTGLGGWNGSPEWLNEIARDLAEGRPFINDDDLPKGVDVEGRLQLIRKQCGNLTAPRLRLLAFLIASHGVWDWFDELEELYKHTTDMQAFRTLFWAHMKTSAHLQRNNRLPESDLREQLRLWAAQLFDDENVIGRTNKGPWHHLRAIANTAVTVLACRNAEIDPDAFVKNGRIVLLPENMQEALLIWAKRVQAPYQGQMPANLPGALTADRVIEWGQQRAAACSQGLREFEGGILADKYTISSNRGLVGNHWLEWRPPEGCLRLTFWDQAPADGRGSGLVGVCEWAIHRQLGPREAFAAEDLFGRVGPSGIQSMDILSNVNQFLLR